MRLAALEQGKPWRPEQPLETFQFDYVFVFFVAVITSLAMAVFGLGGLFLAAIAIVGGIAAFFISPIILLAFLYNEISHYLSGFLHTYSAKWCGRGSNEDLFQMLYISISPMVASGVFFWLSNIYRIRFAGWFVIIISLICTYSCYKYYEIRDHNIREQVCDTIIDKSFHRQR
jgi:hypothetical protein